MSRFKNSKAKIFLDKDLFKTSLDDLSNELTSRCKFNFSYFDNSQDAGQDFSDWTDKQLHKLLNKLKEYSKFSLVYWTTQKIGTGRYKKDVLAIYHDFPSNSDFIFPKHIPHQVKWARFSLENKKRLIGFVIPDSYHSTIHTQTNERFDKNTFYIVFLDQAHKFYKTEKV